MTSYQKNPELSVIVPVYNVESYLPACLNSLLNQSADNLEIIAVNDGSTDDSPKILSTYEEKYENLRVVHQVNAGLSAARNSGIEHSNGKYIGFLDSDDFAGHDAYKTLLEIAAKQKADIVKSGILIFKDKTGSIVKLRQKPDLNIKMDTSNTTLKKYLQGKMNTVVWDGIYRRELFRDLKFPVGRKYEDHYYTPNALLQSKSFCQTSDILFYYRKREGAITHKGDVNGKVDKVQSLNELYNVIQETGNPESFGPLFSKFFLNMVSNYHNSLVYADPLMLRKRNYALDSVINPELFTYILTHGNLSDRSKNDLLKMRKSHWSYFLVQKTRRMYEIIGGINSNTDKKGARDRTPVPEDELRIYRKYLDLYA